jgi:hypothetical protein
MTTDTSNDNTWVLSASGFGAWKWTTKERVTFVDPGEADAWKAKMVKAGVNVNVVDDRVAKGPTNVWD